MPQKTILNQNINMLNTNENENAKPAEPVRTKLYVSNFPQNCSRRTLTEFFSKYGQVLECAIMWDKYAFIHYGSMEEAQNALNDARNMYLMGQRLFIQLSTSRNRQNYDWYQHEAAKLHQELLSKAKNEIDQSLSSNSSFSSNVLVETKLYVTNLPENCNQLELKSLFEQYGRVLECVIMWNHYAFVHFADIREAKIALEHLHGYLFNGKNLIVQLSTSSNRPLPKCVVFGGSAQQNVNNRSQPVLNNQTNQQYNYNYSKRNNEVNKDESKSNEKNWIQIIKNGCLPVIKHQETQKPIEIPINQVEESNKMTQINLGMLFNIQNSTESCSSKSISSISDKISNDLMTSVRDHNDDSEADADTDLELISEPSIKKTSVLPNSKKQTNGNNNTPGSSNKKKISETIRLDQVPTPPLPTQSFIQYNSNSMNNILNNNKIQTENNCLKKLIEKINNSIVESVVVTKKEEFVKNNNDLISSDQSLFKPLQKNQFEDYKFETGTKNETSPVVFSLENDLTYNNLSNINEIDEDILEEVEQEQTDQDDIKNEKILIEQLNILKYQQQELSSTSLLTSLPPQPLLRIDNIFKPSSRSISCSSDDYKTTTTSSSSSPYLSSPTSSPFTVDFLNSKCVYEENLIKQNDTNYDVSNYTNNQFNYFSANDQINDKNTDEYFNSFLIQQLESSCLNESTTKNTSTTSNNIKKPKLSRCKVVNYILFPELKEQNYFDKKQYENDLINLMKQHAKIVI